ncbi:MAG: SpvB/TcaC N-terminal domain-containing protein [Burkholderiaceae bacterium]|nr:SpvB/TcaC N-terminal domain-containing protein [Burkholderiaceae bacterium]
MNKSATAAESDGQGSDQKFTVKAPQIALPKGGGAVHGIGEKFTANPVNGTGSMSVPIAVSPGRSGFGPQLSLTYNSGSGNGPFGYGWSLGLPAIQRKTDKGLPRYADAADSDLFILSGAEDLVPLLQADGSIADTAIDGFKVRCYRPRIEGQFARIERWTDAHSGVAYWRTISRDNVTTVYGKTSASQVVDPDDPTHVYSWLICESYDDKGNAIVYDYVSDNANGVDLAAAHEKNRSDAVRKTNRYIKHIWYGNRVSRLVQPDLTQAQWLFQLVFDYGEGHYQDLPGAAGQTLQALAGAGASAADAWPVRPDPFSSHRAGFEVRTYRRCLRTLMFHSFTELGNDPYLVQTTEFDYHDLDTTQAPPVDTELAWKGSTRIASFIRSVTQSGYLQNAGVPVQVKSNANFATYYKRSLPPVEFDYSQATINDNIQEVDRDSLDNLPIGVDGSNYQWTDLDGEGLHGLLVEQGGAWFYKRNISVPSSDSAPASARFAPLERLTTLPPPKLHGGQQLMDLGGSGLLDVVELDAAQPGYFQRSNEAGWNPFKAFSSLPNIDWKDPNLRFVDVTGDGLADILITEDNAFSWYPSIGAGGYGRAGRVCRALDEEKGPCVLFADGTQSIFLADMCGDGLADLVRVRNSEICYWPNLGYGRFGSKVAMDNAPFLDTVEGFSQSRIRLVDLDGSGSTDLVYLAPDGVRLYFNQSGNRWSDARRLPQFPRVDNLSSVMALDLLGNGTGCLVWSTSLPGATRRQMYYIDLMGGQKPHLLVSAKNNLGAQTQVQYAPSTRFYLADRLAGKRWITRLPFPVHCVAQVALTDQWRKTVFTSSYSYHHGYFDGVEREFRGFGRVEQIDNQSFGVFAAANGASPYIASDKTLYQPPVKTVTWYHTGVYLDQARILNQYESEYFPHWLAELPGAPTVDQVFSEASLPQPTIVSQNPTADEWREALRACKGMMLRQEVMELDVNALEQGREVPVRLYSTAYHSCSIRMLQPQAANPYAAFLVSESEALTYHYDLDLRSPNLQPDPRIAHTLNLSFDDYGNVQQAVAAGYPRVRQYQDAALSAQQLTAIQAVQQERHLVYTETRYTPDAIDSFDPQNPAPTVNYRLRQPFDVQTFELTGIAPAAGRYFTLDDLRAYALSAQYPSPVAVPITVAALPYQQVAPDNAPRMRKIAHHRTMFLRDDLSAALPLGTLGTLGLVYQQYKLALTDDLLNAVFAGSAGNKLDIPAAGGAAVRATLQDATKSGYLSGAALSSLFGAQATDEYWIASGIAGLTATAAQHFYQPQDYTDPFGNVTTLTYDAGYDFYLQSSKDAQGNAVQVTRFDFRALKATQMQDANNNLSELALDILGMPTALALRGKGSEGDSLAAFTDTFSNPAPASLIPFFTGAYDVNAAQQLLAGATVRNLTYFGETQAADGSLQWGQHPPSACTILREQHVAQLPPNQQSALQTAFEYSDGMGQLLVKKMQAEPDTGSTALRWIASGKTIVNNKGKPVKQYEPYFSTSEHRFEEPVEVGVTSILYYDAADQLVRTERPDGSYSRVDYTPWQVSSYDANDTVLEVGNAWYAAMSAATASAEQQRAAQLTAVHANTPSVAFLDSLGRNVVAIVHNRQQYPGDPVPSADQALLTFSRLDAEGKTLWIRDARNNLVIQHVLPPMPNSQATDAVGGYVPGFDMAGNLLYQHSMDAGDRWTLIDAIGKPLATWDFNQSRDNTGTATDESRVFFYRYDALHRPTEEWLTINANPAQMVGRYEYVDAVSKVANAQANNLCGRLVRHFDPSGLLQTNTVDFKGNVMAVQRQLVADYKAPQVDWHSASVAVPDPNLESETFFHVTEYDALNRMTRLYNWHGGNGTRVAVYEPQYNQRGLLQGEDLVVGATKTATGYTEGAGSKRTAVIQALQYDAKGQRQAITHGNGTITRYQYDAQTFRLVELRTTRPGFDPTFPDSGGQLTDAKVLQNLFYTYDPVGNITQIRDDAFAPAFFGNQQVDAQNLYTYDALYRLIASSGRENGAATGAPTQIDAAPMQVAFPVTAANALRNYTEQYQYDAVGNMAQMRHSAGSLGSWTRAYQYAVDSNRLSGTNTGDPTQAVAYQYDAHGNMLNLANVGPAAYTLWDYRDMIRAFNGVGGGWTYYNYDAAKQRTRKVNENQSGTHKQWERIYLGGLEIYRRYNASGLVEQIETLHVMDGERRVLLVEEVLQTDNAALPTGALYRYQYGNHLGSACLELDDLAQIISYEEYHPFGSTAYQGGPSTAEVSLKRYRFTGMEKDEESGLNYHGARYYACWLGRWVSVDPSGVADSLCRYEYVHGRVTISKDLDGKAGVAVVSAQVEKEYPHGASGPASALARILKATHVSKAKKIEEGVHGTHTGGGLLFEQVRDASIATGKKVSEIHSLGHLQSGFDANPKGRYRRGSEGTHYVSDTAPGFAKLLRPFITNDVKIVFHGCGICVNSGIEEFVRGLPVGARVYGHRAYSQPGEPFDWVEYKVATDATGAAIKEKVSLGPGKGTVERIKVERHDLGTDPIIGRLLPKQYVEEWILKQSKSYLQTTLANFKDRIPSDVATLMKDRLVQLNSSRKN